MNTPTLYRDQRRALHAYACVRELLGSPQHNDYRIAVNDLGTNVRRLGLAAALSQIEAEARKHTSASRALLDHLGKAGITGLANTNADSIADAARKLDVDRYMLATRELLQVATWFRRAVQALMSERET